MTTNCSCKARISPSSCRTEVTVALNSVASPRTAASGKSWSFAVVWRSILGRFTMRTQQVYSTTSMPSLSKANRWVLVKTFNSMSIKNLYDSFALAFIYIGKNKLLIHQAPDPGPDKHDWLGYRRQNWMPYRDSVAKRASIKKAISVRMHGMLVIFGCQISTGYDCFAFRVEQGLQWAKAK